MKWIEHRNKKIFEENDKSRFNVDKGIPSKEIFRKCCYVIIPELSKIVFADI